MRVRWAVALMVAVTSSIAVFTGSPAMATAPGLDGILSVRYLGYIYVVDPVKGLDRLGEAGVTDGDSATWSPDGSLLAVNDGGSIVTFRPDGSGGHLIITPGCLDGRVTWSPDASQIAHQSCNGVAIVDVATGQEIPIPNSLGLRWLAWSPDGEWIAGARVTGEDGDADLWKIRPDGSDLTQIVDRVGHQLIPSWSPDGSQIAFDDAAPGTNTDVSVVAADGGTVTTLTGAATNDGYPAWSPSGQRIAFNSSRDGGGLFTMAADGTDVRKVRSNYGLESPDWQPAQATITASEVVVNSGAKVRLDVRVANPDTDVPLVTIQRRVMPGTWKDFTTATVDDTGRGSVRARVLSRTLFRAVWAGDATSLGGRSAQIVVEARAIVSGTLKRYEGRQGHWYLYRNGSRVWYTGRIRPASPDEKLCFELEVLRNGRWRDVFRDCYRLQGAGTTASLYIYNIPANERGRLRASFAQTPELLRDVSPWSYFRMTG